MQIDKILNQAEDTLINDKFIDFNALDFLHKRVTGGVTIGKQEKAHPLQQVFLSQHIAKSSCYLRLNKAIGEAHSMLERNKAHDSSADLFKGVDPVSDEAAQIANDWFQKVYASGDDHSDVLNNLDIEDFSSGQSSGLSMVYQFFKGVVAALASLHAAKTS